MAKIGRNDQCYCGSGKKYKRCCLDKDVAQTSAQLAKETEERKLHDHQHQHLPLPHHPDLPLDDEDRLTEESNAVVDLIHAGKLDEAELAAHALIRDYPDAIDGFDRLAMICLERGDPRAAVQYFRQALANLEKFSDVDDFDHDVKRWYHDKIAELEAGSTA
jgi:tetratricopeptide (TPR) repeat protein